MAQVELTTEMVVGNVTFVKNDTYALRQHQLMPNLKELVCVYDIIVDEVVIGRLMLLKAQPVPNAPFISMDVYIDDKNNKKVYVGSFDNTVFPNLTVTPSRLNELFHITAEIIEQYGVVSDRKPQYNFPFDHMPIYAQELNKSLIKQKDTYLTIFRTPFHVVVDDAGFAKNGGHVDFHIVSQIPRHIISGSIFVAYEKDCIRITPLRLNDIESVLHPSAAPKGLYETLFRQYVIDGPTFEIYKDVSVSAQTLIRTYVHFFEATYVMQYGVVDHFYPTFKQTAEPAAPKVPCTTDPSYVRELSDRVETSNPFKENRHENLPTE